MASGWWLVAGVPIDCVFVLNIFYKNKIQCMHNAQFVQFFNSMLSLEMPLKDTIQQIVALRLTKMTIGVFFPIIEPTSLTLYSHCTFYISHFAMCSVVSSQ